MLINIAVLVVSGLAALILLRPALRRATVWRAMTTPLASIIGSGFLVLGPILTLQFGYLAPVIMALLCIAAALFGRAIRYNMVQLEAGAPWPEGMEALASWALAFAYVVSVAYYLNLLGAFAVSLTPFDTVQSARIVTSLVYLAILVAGFTGGFETLENLEYISVTAKLAIIAGLVAGLVLFFGQRVQADALILRAPQLTGWPAVTLLFGLIVTVQGFETSRYLGDSYDTATRTGSMRLAQIVSSVIYMIYILLLAYVFELDALSLSETAIIDMMGVVAPVLPLLLVAAALAAQFSAAVADTGGSGGLMAELSGGRLSARGGYLVLTMIGLALTWGADVFLIISYASRAFALYYALQCIIAARVAGQAGQGARAAGFGALAALGLAIALFGRAIES